MTDTGVRGLTQSREDEGSAAFGRGLPAGKTGMALSVRLLDDDKRAWAIDIGAAIEIVCLPGDASILEVDEGGDLQR